MKKILTICVVMMISLACSSNNQINNNKHKKLLIEGYFVGERNVVCTLYKLDSAGNFIQEEKKNYRNGFIFSCEIGFTYVIQFTNKDLSTKLLLVEATVADQYALDVDFTSTWNATLKHQGNGYSLHSINKEQSKTLFAQK
jgi:hypothetical protein